MHAGQYNGAADGQAHQQQQQHYIHPAARQDTGGSSAPLSTQPMQQMSHMRAPLSPLANSGGGAPSGIDNGMSMYQRGTSSYQTVNIPGVAELIDDNTSRDLAESGFGHYHHSEAAYANAASASNMYPSTLLPSRQILAQHHHNHPHNHPHHQQLLRQQMEFAPVRLLQSCDSCRRRKIRCSGEKPTCSSCVRYQEVCHYSPLATPKRRAGKRARTGEREASAELMPTTPAAAGTTGAAVMEAPRDVSVAPSQSAPLSADNEQPISREGERGRGGGRDAGVWSSESHRMRKDIEGLSRKFDSL
ncbi:hypothetical protein GGI21_002769, partial [Coemansia aciculifera]